MDVLYAYLDYKCKTAFAIFPVLSNKNSIHTYKKCICHYRAQYTTDTHKRIENPSQPPNLEQRLHRDSHWLLPELYLALTSQGKDI